MPNTKKSDDSLAIEVIGNALKIPGVKVDRKDFLEREFQGADSATFKEILEKGPVNAGVGRDVLKRVFVNRKTDISLCRFSTLRQQVPTRFLDFRFP